MMFAECKDYDTLGFLVASKTMRVTKTVFLRFVRNFVCR